MDFHDIAICQIQENKLKENSRKILKWASYVFLIDIFSFFLISIFLKMNSSSEFGPSQQMQSISDLYQKLHWPLSGWVSSLQASLGTQGNYLQGWSVPLAQGLRLALFGINTFFGAWAWLFVVFTLGKEDINSNASQLVARLKVLDSGKEPFVKPVPNPNTLQRRKLKLLLTEIKEELLQDNGAWRQIIQLRGRLLHYLPMFWQDSEAWLVLGESTLVLELTGHLEPNATTVAFGIICLKRAWGLEPRHPDILAALLKWRVVEGEEGLAVSEVLNEINPIRAEPFLWRIRQKWTNGEINAAKAVEELVERLPHAIESQRLRAEIFESSGDFSSAFELWKTLTKVQAHDRRCWRRAIESASKFDQEKAIVLRGALTRIGPECPNSRDWLYLVKESGPEKVLYLNSFRIAVGSLILFPLGLILSFAVAPGRSQANDSIGRWTCSAVIEPNGERISINRLPRIFKSYLAEEACGYEKITEIAQNAAFIIKPNFKGEAYLGGLLPLTWETNDSGMVFHRAGDRHDPVLRIVEDGIEMSIPGYNWNLYFERNDQTHTPANKDWIPQEPQLIKTWAGDFLSLGARGWVQVRRPGEALELYEGANALGKPLAEPDPERDALASSWGDENALYQVKQTLGAAMLPSCGKCYSPPNCHS